MRLVTFSEALERPFRIGILVSVEQEELVIDLHQVDASLPETMSGLLREVGGDFTAVQKAALAAPSNTFIPLNQLVLGPVVSDPEKILCIGLNYKDHAIETGNALPDAPNVFAKMASSLNGSGQPIRLPRHTREVDYEAELAVVIGRRAKEVCEADAMSYVAGYTIMNDVSARDYQRRTTQWVLGKSPDTFAPIGPCLVTADEVVDPHALQITLTINGEVLQDSNTRNMIFKIPQLITYISALVTLEPGDVIATGTPAGVGFTRKPPRYLHAGDTVRVEIEGLGALSNQVQEAGEGPEFRHQYGV